MGLQEPCRLVGERRVEAAEGDDGMSGAPSDPSPYRGRTAVMATKHQKEVVIGPPLSTALGLALYVPPNLDTDALGTFTGEIPREGPPRSVAVRKARMGMEAAHMSLGLANEGSFGPFPSWPMVPADHEILVFLDDDLGIEVVEQWLSPETNFASVAVHPDDADELTEFLGRVKFPGHGLIVRPHSGLREGYLWKGIVDPAVLRDAVARAAAASQDGMAYVETDMRSHMNPSRQQVLATLAARLGERLAAACPACGAPGWGLIDVVRGLACESCGAATPLVKAEVFGCGRCSHQESNPPAHGLAAAPAGDCEWCNP